MESRQELYKIFHPLIKSGPPEDTIAVLEKLVELWPDFATAHNDLGVLYYNAGEKDNALIHYQEAVRLQRGNIIFQKNLADFYYVEQGRVEDALRIYIKVLESNPEDVETLVVAGHICVSLRRFDDAEFFYNRALEIEPWNLEIQENLEKLKNAQQAQGEPESPEDMYENIRKLVGTGQSEEVIQEFKNLLESWPDFAVAHNDLGVLYYDKGDKEKALSHYREAARCQPENITFNKNLADFYYVEKGQIEQALEIYVNILKSHPDDIETLMATGHICESLKKPDDARVFYNRVLEIEPWHVEARQKLEPV